RSEKTNLTEQIIANSRQMYSRPVEEVEDYITEWSTPINLSDPSKQPIPQPYEELKTRTDAFAGQDGGSKAGEGEEKKDQPSSESKNGGEGEEKLPVAKEPGRGANLPPGMKTEIIKDRFDRPWYAVTQENKTEDGGAGNQDTEQTENGGVTTQADIESDPVVESTEINTQSGGVAPEENTPPTTEDGGGASENDQLISWDDAEQLGIQVQMEPSSESIKSADDQGLTPLDEIR
ncbi:MAG: hypothetical protein Q7K33_04605, partial [Candidatus Berkelbacteria bacterium]|nr:hypothetical protein [Candidatus Berkelbacteria bacterium]